MGNTATADTDFLAKFAAADIRSARRNGFIIVCQTKRGTIELARCAGRGMIEVDGQRMTTKAAKALLVASYVVVD